jgi:hypothetical protein
MPSVIPAVWPPSASSSANGGSEAVAPFRSSVVVGSRRRIFLRKPKSVPLTDVRPTGFFVPRLTPPSASQTFSRTIM